MFYNIITTVLSFNVAMPEDTKRDWRGRRSSPTMVTASEQSEPAVHQHPESAYDIESSSIVNAVRSQLDKSDRIDGKKPIGGQKNRFP